MQLRQSTLMHTKNGFSDHFHITLIQQNSLAKNKKQNIHTHTEFVTVALCGTMNFPTNEFLPFSLVPLSRQRSVHWNNPLTNSWTCHIQPF